MKKFQKQQKLTPDGIAGPATLKKLGITIGSMPEQVLSDLFDDWAAANPFIGGLAGVIVIDSAAAGVLAVQKGSLIA